MTDEPIVEAKQKARRSAALHREHSFRDAGPSASDRVAARFMEKFGDLDGKVIAAYSPIKDEIGTLVLMHRASAREARVVLPVVSGAGQPLIFREWTPTTQLTKGAYGAMIPPQECPELIPDIIILPLLAFDLKGYRLGYGGGFYDRTLEALRAEREVLAVGFGFAGQEMRNVPHEATDQKLDAIVTEVEARWLIPQPEAVA